VASIDLGVRKGIAKVSRGEEAKSYQPNEPAPRGPEVPVEDVAGAV
jgi:hypothetical protein